MKKYFYYLSGIFCLGLLFCLTACKKAESIRTSMPKPEMRIEALGGKIIHLYKDTVYILSQQFTRNAEEQLIIDEGTLIKVDAALAPSIIINPGGIIIANGTRDNPIVFTSNALPGDQKTNWGGIIITGKSVNNSTGPIGDLTDISGSLNYVRIEFGSLILMRVGNRTILENVQVSYANPGSSFEIHGGSFDVRYLISYACGGPADFYITGGYSGRMQNLLAYRHPFFGNPGSNPGNALAGVFIENNSSNPVSARPYTYPFISNLTVLGPVVQNESTQAYADTNILSAALVTTGSTGFRIRNSVLLGFPGGGSYLGDSLTATGIRYNLSELTHSILHSNNTDRVFYLRPDIYRPFISADFKNYMLDQRFRNQVFDNVRDFMLEDPFNYDAGPNPLPRDNSPVLGGANFDGIDFGNLFFNKVSYVGAFGKDNWLKGWTNFIPLKTNYNIPR